jgi:hypothetical protein
VPGTTGLQKRETPLVNSRGTSALARPWSQEKPIRLGVGKKANSNTVPTASEFFQKTLLPDLETKHWDRLGQGHWA